MPFRRERKLSLPRIMNEVEINLRYMIAHRPMLSSPITSYKDPEKKKRASVSSFSQEQSVHDPNPRESSGSDSMYLDTFFQAEHPSLLSLMTDNSEESTLHGFESLAESHHFYIRPTEQSAPEFEHHKFKMEVLDHRGFRLYFAYEAKGLKMNQQGCWCGVREIKPFEIRVVNFLGHEVLRIEGEPGICGAGKMAHFYQGTDLLGRVEQENDYGSTGYQVFKDQHPISCIKGPDTGCCGCGLSSTRSKLQFELLTNDNAFHLGKLSKGRPRFSSHGLQKSPGFNCFGAVFYSKEIDVKVKVLILGTLFLLHFEFINFNSRE